MSFILRIDSSARNESSHSRRIANRIEAALVKSKPQLKVQRRDLSREPLPHIEDDTIQGFYTLPDQLNDELRRATALSDKLIEELMSAEILLISAPIYNFGVPSSLKAWIDQVVRIGRTFSYIDGEFGGLVPANKAIVATSFGAVGYGEGGAFAPMNFLEPYLVSLLSFLGISDVEVFRIEGTTGEAEHVEAETNRIFQQIDRAFAPAA